MFPHLPGQSGYDKRLRAAGPLIAAVITELARDTASWHDLLRLVDSTPVPCAASRETVKRSDLAGHAGNGYCASHSRFFWGFRLYLICTAEGMPVIWGLANPKLGEREVTGRCWNATTTWSAPGRSSSATRASPAAIRGLHHANSAPTCPPRPQGRTRPASASWPAPPVDRVRLRHPQRPAHPRRPRRPHPRRRLRPRRRPPPRPGRRDLAQLAHRRTDQTLPDRLRPLNHRTHSSSSADSHCQLGKLMFRH